MVILIPKRLLDGISSGIGDRFLMELMLEFPVDTLKVFRIESSEILAYLEKLPMVILKKSLVECIKHI